MLRDYFLSLAEGLEPRLRYRGGNIKEWQTAVRDAVQGALLRVPDPVPLNPITVSVEERDGIWCERIAIQTEALVSLPFVVLHPRGGASVTVKKPALICLHGHGPFGKESLIGAAQTEEERAVIARYNYDYALQFSKRGWMTVSPDLRNFGERSVRDEMPGKDSCNVHFLRGLLLGFNLMTLNVWDVQRLVDYLTTRHEVDARRIGVVGFSLGGTTALLAAAIEPRIVAAGLFSSLSTWKTYALDLGHFCGSQVLPGLLPDADWPEVAGLIAPRPLYISHRRDDDVFPVDVALSSYQSLRNIYRDANAADRVVMETENGEHMFAMLHALEFFEHYLGACPSIVV